jgi:hypothetical protein
MFFWGIWHTGRRAIRTVTRPEHIQRQPVSHAFQPTMLHPTPSQSWQARKTRLGKVIDGPRPDGVTAQQWAALQRATGRS